MEFEWDPRKADINLRKHGVSFTEAATIFGDEFAVTVSDPDRSGDEDRSFTIGWSERRRLIMVLTLTEKTESELSALVN